MLLKYLLADICSVFRWPLVSWWMRLDISPRIHHLSFQETKSNFVNVHITPKKSTRSQGLIGETLNHQGTCYLSIFRGPIFPCNFRSLWWIPGSSSSNKHHTAVQLPNVLPHFSTSLRLPWLIPLRPLALLLWRCLRSKPKCLGFRRARPEATKHIADSHEIRAQ